MRPSRRTARSVTVTAVIAALGLLLAGCGLFGGGSAAPAPRPVPQGQPTQQQMPTQQSAPTAGPNSDTNQGPSSNSGSTVTLQGQTYTCQQVMDLVEPCDQYNQEAFDSYGGNLGPYVNSDLGSAVNGLRLRDKAYIGIAYCSYADGETYGDMGQQIAVGLDRGVTSDQLYPAFDAAEATLC